MAEAPSRAARVRPSGLSDLVRDPDRDPGGGLDAVRRTILARPPAHRLPHPPRLHRHVAIRSGAALLGRLRRPRRSAPEAWRPRRDPDRIRRLRARDGGARGHRRHRVLARVRDRGRGRSHQRTGHADPAGVLRGHGRQGRRDERGRAQLGRVQRRAHRGPRFPRQRARHHARGRHAAAAAGGGAPARATGGDGALGGRGGPPLRAEDAAHHAAPRAALRGQPVRLQLHGLHPAPRTFTSWGSARKGSVT